MAKVTKSARAKKDARKKKFRKLLERGRCRWCRDERVNAKAGDKSPVVLDYKDVSPLQKQVTAQGKLFSRKRSGNCARHQNDLKLAVKHARFLGLMPYVG